MGMISLDIIHCLDEKFSVFPELALSLSSSEMKYFLLHDFSSVLGTLNLRSLVSMLCMLPVSYSAEF
jgi:hypothetical protein